MPSNETEPKCEEFLKLALHVQVPIWVLGTILIISLCWNIFFCVSKCCTGERRNRRRRSPRQMEDNPIYGNLGYVQTSMTEPDLAHSRDPSRVNFSQSKTQECYANLTLKAPRVQSGRSSPQIQYSDVVQLEAPPESDKEDEGNTDGVSVMSDLYASVQTQRAKIVDTADGGEGYANHL